MEALRVEAFAQDSLGLVKVENLVKGSQWVEEVLVGARVNKVEEDVAYSALMLKHELLVVRATFVRVYDLEDQRQEKADHRAEPFRVA